MDSMSPLLLLTLVGALSARANSFPGYLDEVPSDPPTSPSNMDLSVANAFACGAQNDASPVGTQIPRLAAGRARAALAAFTWDHHGPPVAPTDGRPWPGPTPVPPPLADKQVGDNVDLASMVPDRTGSGLPVAAITGAKKQVAYILSE